MAEALSLYAAVALFGWGIGHLVERAGRCMPEID